jgi:hypothetical protein
MSQTFSYDLSVADAPAIAQARLRTVVTESVLRSTKMRLGTEVNGSLAYRPPINFPLVVAVTQNQRGERQGRLHAGQGRRHEDRGLRQGRR